MKILRGFCNFLVDRNASIGIKIRIIFKAIAIPIVRMDVLNLCYIDIQIRPILYLKSGKDVPERLSIFQINMIIRKAHQGMTIDGNFENSICKGQRNLERLIKYEWETSRTSFSVTPARTLREF